MFKHYRLFALGATALMTASAFCAAPGNRVFYGFSLGSAEFADATKEYDYGFVSYPFDPTEDDAEIFGKMLDSYYENPSVGVYAGTGVNGLIYACEYSASGVMMQPQPGDMVVYNTFNGTKEIIGQWNPENTDFKPQDMTWSEKDGKMYAVGFSQSKSGLYEVDIKNAKFKFLCNLTGGGATIAAAPDGTLYSLNSAGVLYTINPANGKATLVFDTGLGSMLNMQSMEFDRASGLLYWVSMTNGHPQGYENSWLQEIDPEKKTIREVGTVGIGNRFVALHIPSAQNLMAPAAPTEVKSVPATDGSLSAKITWTAPSTTLNGDEALGTLYSYVITRNGEQVRVGTTADGVLTPGAEMEWTDTTIPETGNYRYDIFYINGKGNGATGTVYQYIGPDAPGKVSAIKGEPMNDMRALRLTWEAPTAGRHLGAYDPSTVKYTVTRNDNEVVAKDITDCFVVDNDFLRVSKYSYTVTASNEQGSSDAFSEGFIVGPAMEIPFEQTFENDAQVQNLWTAVDANNDGISWMFNTTLAQMAFGDYESAAEYIVSSPLGNALNGSADEWLISPPLKFEAGMEYELTISSRSYSTDQMDFYLGNVNTPEGMTEKFGNLDIVHDPQQPDIDPVVGTVAFRRRSVAIPAFNEDAVRCIGIHLNTLHPEAGYLQINGIFVGEPGEYSGIADAETVGQNVSISVNGKILTIAGSFRKAELFDMSGRKVASTASPVIDLNNFMNGVYVLNIDGRSFKIAL